MWIETVSYIATFIISAGLAAIGIMVSFQLYAVHQKPVLQILFYQQVFLISFFVYGIWGSMAIQQLISDVSLNPDLETKLSVFIPMLGVPFLLVSWFMLARFVNVLSGYRISRISVFAFFGLFIVITVAFAILLQKGMIDVPEKPQLFIVRVFVWLNLAVHLFVAIKFYSGKRANPISKEIRFRSLHFSGYLLGVILYSSAFYFYDFLGFVSVCISTVLVFAVGISIPVIIKLNEKTQLQPVGSKDFSFHDFCVIYEISKREAEVVLEICDGKTNKAISEKLFIALQTVKDHNHRIFTKTGVKSRVQLTNLVREKTGGQKV